MNHIKTQKERKGGIKYLLKLNGTELYIAKQQRGKYVTLTPIKESAKCFSIDLAHHDTPIYTEKMKKMIGNCESVKFEKVRYFNIKNND